MTRPEECIAVIDGIGHASTFTPMPDGSILAFSSSRFQTSKDGGKTWSAAWRPKYTGKDFPHLEDGSLVLFKDKTLGYVGRVVSAMPDMGPKPKDGTPEKKAYDEIRDKYKKQRDVYMMLWRSNDGGKTWSGSTRVSPPFNKDDPYNQGCLNNVLVRAASGRILVPAYGGGRVFVYFTDDEGVTWKQSKPVKSYINHEGGRIELKGSEPSITEVEPGRFLLVVRNDSNRVFQSWSNDNGATWSEGTGMPLAASRSPAAVGTIPGTKDLVIVWNQATVKELRQDLWRARLSVAISRDKGRTWTNFQNIESSLEGTKVDLEPIHPEWLIKDLNPRQDDLPGYPAYEKPPDKKTAGNGRKYGSFTYPSMFFHGNTIFICHSDLHFNKEEAVTNGRLRILPISWLYGGKMPDKALVKAP